MFEDLPTSQHDRLVFDKGSLCPETLAEKADISLHICSLGRMIYLPLCSIALAQFLKVEAISEHLLSGTSSTSRLNSVAAA